MADVALLTPVVQTTAMQANTGMQQMAPAALIEVGTASGARQNGIVLQTGLVQNRINNIVQFSVNNAGNANKDIPVRFGSIAAMPDIYALYKNMGGPGAADDPVIRDQGGPQCLAIQGFSRITSIKPVIIKRVKIMTAGQDVQLAQPLVYRSIQLDGKMDEITANIAFRNEKTDVRMNMVEIVAPFVLDAQQFIEYVVLGGKSFDIFFEISGFANSEIFLPMVSS